VRACPHGLDAGKIIATLRDRDVDVRVVDVPLRRD
jgi:hypothetical protein